MAINSALNKTIAFPPTDTVMIEKIRRSLRQRLRKQMRWLTVEFFDEVDDFLFSSGQQGQFSDACIYLKAMREFRTKQGLFEKIFLDSLLNSIRATSRDGGVSLKDSIGSNRIGSAAVSSEKMEIELALKSMKRKAEKLYSPFIEQIGSVNRKFFEIAQDDLVEKDFLVKATLAALAEAQCVFSVALDLRLVFIKLFEKHYLLKMEELFLDIINSLDDVSAQNFINKHGSPFTTAGSQLLRWKKMEARLNKQRNATSYSASRKSETVETALDELVSTICEQQKLPLFVEKMIRTKWRAVMFLIGLNWGSSSTEWFEAKHTISLLAASIGNASQIDETERQWITSQLEKGFELIQFSKEEQQQFLAELEDYMSVEPPVAEGQLAGEDWLVGANVWLSAEASISPCGEQILDRDDLSEIAKLITSEQPDKQDARFEKPQAEYLPAIDQLLDGNAVEFLIDDTYQAGSLYQNSDNPNLFDIRIKDTKISITRSRLGLAVSLQDGELRMPRIKATQASIRKTIMEKLAVKSSA